MKSRQKKVYTVEEYLALERTSEAKHEFHNGKVFALAGGTLSHGLLCGNIYAECREQLKELNCTTLNSEIKLHVGKVNSFLHPDVMVVCGEIETSPVEKNSVINPVLIVEVLSKSTADYDRGDKFFHYRQIAAFQEHVLVEQSKPLVEVFYKKLETHSWEISRYSSFDDDVQLQSLGISIAMKDIYQKVSF